MKKSLFKKLILVGILLTVSIVSVIAQDGNTTEEPASGMDKIMQWMTGGGLLGLVAIILGFWKKGVAFLGKVATALFDISGELGNIMVQTAEANAKIRNGLSKMEVYSADGKFTKEELEDLIKEIKGAIDEADDIPVALKSFKATFEDVVSRFKKK